MTTFFDGMTDAQILELSDAQLNRMVSLECAARGIPLFLDPGVAPVRPVQPDGEFWELADFIFTNQADAIEVANLLKSKPMVVREYCYRTYSQSDNVKPRKDFPEVTRKVLFTQATAEKWATELSTFKSQTEAYENQKKTADDASEKKAAVWQEMWNLRRAAADRVDETARLDSTFKSYLDLANGNAGVALRFLQQAEKLDERWRPNCWDAVTTTAAYSEADNSIVPTPFADMEVAGK